MTRVAPLLALDNGVVLDENSQAWVVFEGFEDGIEDLVSSDSMSITSTSPDVDKAVILPGISSQA